MKASPEERKNQLLAELALVRRLILEAARTIPVERRAEAFLGSWCLRDLLAHLIGWDYANLEAIRELLEGSLPSFYRRHDANWRSYNAELVSKYDQGSFEQLLEALERSHRELLGALESLSPERMAADQGVRFRRYKVTIESLMKVELEDERQHLKQIADFGASLRCSS